MADQRDGGIAWTDESWNPVRGCSRVSEGCRHCYAESVAARFSGPGQPYHGLAVRKLKVISDEEQRTEARWTGEVQFVHDHLADPIRWKRPRRIFVNSMSDVFHEKVSVEEIAAIWAVMLLAHHHTYQVLTKRAERMRAVLTDPGFYERVLEQAEDLRRYWPRLFEVGISNPTTHPRAWIWLGVSAENQAAADQRIPLLFQTPAAVRFVSAEPLLSGIELDCVPWPPGWRAPDDIVSDGVDPLRFDRARLDWVIVGGESGRGARVCDVSWIRSIVAQCKRAGTACFVKQLGAAPIETDANDFSEHRSERLRLSHPKGGNIDEWPAELRVQQFPKVSR